MEEIKNKEHDFSLKLRQASVIERLKKYISWQRSIRAGNEEQHLPYFAPLSINLDLTTACNFACPYCVDAKIIKSGKTLNIENVKNSIDCLKLHGLSSVIFLGGGEPTLHSNFEEIVKYIKAKQIQVGIVTNGTVLKRIEGITDVLEKNDWLRISIDAARQDTFFKSHMPKVNVILDEILDKARKIKRLNPLISLGYSFVIVWEGIKVKGHKLVANVEEIPDAVNLAKEHNFDYISYKPCLLRLEESQKESLFDIPDSERELGVIKLIRQHIEKAKEIAKGQIKILESINLIAMMNEKVHELKKQPHVCHMQFFRAVFTPLGIFHCPAFRGVEKAKIAGPRGYMTKSNLDDTLQNLTYSLVTFDAAQECNVIACFYHHANWWLEIFIQSDKSVEELEQVMDDNFFL